MLHGLSPDAGIRPGAHNTMKVVANNMCRGLTRDESGGVCPLLRLTTKLMSCAGMMAADLWRKCSRGADERGQVHGRVCTQALAHFGYASVVSRSHQQGRAAAVAMLYTAVIQWVL